MRSVRVHGHFGEYVQGKLGPDGPVALITVPCRKTGLDARLHYGEGHGYHPTDTLLKALDLASRGRVVISPFSPPGAGTGISTATLVATALLHAWQGPPERLMAACVAQEGASDPLAFPYPARLLWASREGRVLQAMPAIPAHDVIGGYFGMARPTDPADTVFADVSDIVAAWEGTTSLEDFAALSSESARRCLRLRGPGDDPTECLARELGAVGFIIAHTGSARGLIFPKGKVPLHASVALKTAGITEVMVFANDAC